MKSFFTSVGGLTKLTAAILPAWFITLPMVAGPRIEIVEPALWNFGSVTNLSEISHDYVIRNPGDDYLEISRVLSGCGSCLRTSIDRLKIPPGETSILHCQLDLRTMNGPTSRTVTLASNDPRKPSIAVELAGTVVPLYRVTPIEVSLDLTEGRRTAMAEIVPLRQLRAPLSRVVCNDTNLFGKVSMLASNRFDLSVQALESFPQGRMPIDLTVRTADSNDPPCLVRVFVHNPGDLEVLPARLDFQPKAGSQMRILWLKQRGKTPLLLLDAIAPSDKFHCEIDPDPAGYNYRIYVTASQQEAEGGRTNAVILKLRDAAGQERSVAVPILVHQTFAGSKEDVENEAESVSQ